MFNQTRVGSSLAAGNANSERSVSSGVLPSTEVGTSPRSCKTFLSVRKARRLEVNDLTFFLSRLPCVGAA